MSADNETTAISENSIGSVIQHSYVKRSVRVLAIFEDEAKSLSFMNAQSTIYFALLSACWSFASSTWLNAAFQSAPTPESIILSNAVSPIVALLGVVFGGLGILSVRQRGSTLDRIKEQSKNVQQ